MNALIIVVVLVAAVCADPSGSYGRGGAYQYHGHYRNQCGNDGFYYKDAHSFVMCSNGNAYVQPCAPGTRSSGNYNYGGWYRAHSFCDVNLVDHGYGARHGYGGNGYGYGGRGNAGYGYYGYGGGNYAYNGRSRGHYGGLYY